MTADEFRAVALSMAGAVEVGHMRHPDFRKAGKIFATFGSPGDGWGMVKLMPEQQAVLVGAEPVIFAPASGAWGRQGSTLVCLAAASESDVRPALQLAYENIAHTSNTRVPKRRKPLSQA
jgi:hypothetical protein